MAQAKTSGPAVGLIGVTKSFGAQSVLDIARLDIAAGSFVALVGSSGSGKSTLLRMVNRLVVPDAGTVTVDGRDVAEDDVHELRRRIGYVIQGVGLFPHMTVGRNIAIGLEIAGRAVRDHVAELLRLVALSPDFADRMPAQLSGGQRQRVGVARALAASPGLMLMDEPFGALDPVTRDALGTAYRSMQDRLGLTTMFVTHDMAEALLLADRIIVLDHGRIVGDSTPRGLLHGQGGAVAQAMVAVPRHHAERLAALR